MSSRVRVAQENFSVVLPSDVKGSRHASDMGRVISHLLRMGKPTFRFVLQFVQFSELWALDATRSENLAETARGDGLSWHAAVVVGVYLDKERLFGAQEVGKYGFLNCSVEVCASVPAALLK